MAALISLAVLSPARSRQKNSRVWQASSEVARCACARSCCSRAPRNTHLAAHASSSDLWLALAGGSLQNGFRGGKSRACEPRVESRDATARGRVCFFISSRGKNTRARCEHKWLCCRAWRLSNGSRGVREPRGHRVASRGAPARGHVWCLRTTHATPSRVMQATAIVLCCRRERLSSLSHTCLPTE